MCHCYECPPGGSAAPHPKIQNKAASASWPAGAQPLRTTTMQIALILDKLIPARRPQNQTRKEASVHSDVERHCTWGAQRRGFVTAQTRNGVSQGLADACVSRLQESRRCTYVARNDVDKTACNTARTAERKHAQTQRFPYV